MHKLPFGLTGRMEKIMNKRINGKRYDTETAKEMASASWGAVRDFRHSSETLYRKTTGEFFLHGEGGPASKYARSVGQNEWAGGERIIPLTFEEAEEWGEKNLDADECDKIFGEVDESGEKQTVAIRLSQGMLAKLKNIAAKEQIGISEVVERLIEEKKIS